MFKNTPWKKLCLVVAVWALFGVGAQALTIDTFQQAGLLASSTTVGAPQTLHMSAVGAIGGGRSFRAEKTGAGVGVSRIEVADGALGYTQGAHAGMASVVWDGDTDPTSVNYDGLAGVDFSQDGGTAFNLGLAFFDYPFNQPLQVVLRVYDASRADGTKFSEVALTLDQYFDGPGTFTIVLPFALFATAGGSTVPAPAGLRYATLTTLGSNGAVDIRNVGALTLTINGTSNAKAPDVIISPFVTNGRCAAVPNLQGRVLDDCSVCLNHADAGKGRDRCGTCRFGPSGYAYASNKVIDDCNLCPTESGYSFPHGVTDSCGVCVKGPPSYTYVDNSAACDAQRQNCTFVAPTKQIRSFEKQLLKKAEILKDRFVADVQRFLDHKCPGSIERSDAVVTEAYGIIRSKGKEVFRKGVQVCGNSCVTVSFASDVKALTPQFRILEKEVAATAQMVQTCYRKRGLTARPSKGGGRASQTIANVRQDISKLIKDCQKTKVCPKR
jgi:hypothetical protein